MGGLSLSSFSFFLLEMLNTEKASLASRGFRLFLFLSLPKASFYRSINKKALAHFRQGFFGVAEGGFEPPTFGL
jgi:hypothetical protein